MIIKPSLLVIIACSSFIGARTEAIAQTTVESEAESLDRSQPTIFRQAGDYSAKHDVLSIAVLRGAKDREQYDEFIKAVGAKLTEKGVPYKFFQKFNDKPGTVFSYFIENDLNGSFDVEEFAAILPHVVKRYKAKYPN